MCQTPGWLEYAKRTKEACENVGKLAVYPMLKSDVLLDRLTRANERLKMLEEVDSYVRQIDGLKKRFYELTGEEYKDA